MLLLLFTYMSHITRILSRLGAFAFLVVPSLASAATTGSDTTGSGKGIDKLGEFLLQFVYLIDNYLVPLVFAIAFIVFLWGIYLYFIQGGSNEEKREKGRSLALWGFIGFFIMVSVWGIVNLLLGSLDLNNSARPDLPTFGSGSSATQSTSNSAAFPTAGSAGTGGAGSSGNSAPTNVCANVQCTNGYDCNPATGACNYNAATGQALY